MPCPCRESNHSDGITDQKSLQRTSATKSANSGHSKASIKTSVLRQNVRRRMMMRYAPFIPTLGYKHGETRWGGNRFAIDHPSKSVKTSDHYCVLVDYDCAPFINRIFVTGSFGGREISHDRLGPLGNHRADSAESTSLSSRQSDFLPSR